ncbi:hypothetical protein VI817_010539 [Penicillium citrinum]|nr:hypothetical protein VI817_010539 [Penicillium citrinum]
MPIDYEYKLFCLVVGVDTSIDGWEGFIAQIREGIRKPARYESGIWSEAERQYNADKRECRDILKALKKFRHWLYGVHFVLEIDAKTLVSQLNRSATDLPGALVTNWIAWIRLFDFEVKHVPGNRHTAADALSRRPATEEDLYECEKESDIDNFVTAEIGCLRVGLCPFEADSEGNRVLDASYSNESEQIAKFLTTLRRPDGIGSKGFRAFKKHALMFVVQGDHLFRRPKQRGALLQRVLDNEKERKRIVASCHDELAHKGREATYCLMKTRYYWEGMYKAVKHYIRTCPNCQFRAPDRQYEPFQPNKVTRLWEMVFMDITHMPTEDSYRVIIQARNRLSGWVEARPLKGRSANCQTVSQFLWEDVICRFGWPEYVVMDSGPEFRSEMRQFMLKKNIKRTTISPYNPGSNGPIERSMRTLKDALSKMTNGYSTFNTERPGTNRRRRKGKRGETKSQPSSWRECFYAALLADRVTVNSQTGVSPYRLLMGIHATLPIELEMPTWSTLPWNKIETREDLLAMRARQILQRDENMQEAIFRLERMRERNREHFDSKKSLREHPLSVDDMVLLHDTADQYAFHSDVKLRYRWHGPYKIMAVKGRGAYTLKELDGTPMRGSLRPDGTRDNLYNGKSLKKFWFRKGAKEGVERNGDETEETDEADKGEDLGDEG